MRIEELGLSVKCINALKRSGFTQAEEVIEFLEGWQRGFMFEADWLFCTDEILKQIKAHGFWSEEFERNWPSDVKSDNH